MNRLLKIMQRERAFVSKYEEFIVFPVIGKGEELQLKMIKRKRNREREIVT